MARKTSHKGRLIAIEGSDGSGKATQSRLLIRRLRGAGIMAEHLAFPRYARSFFGRMAAQYLRGEFGPGEEVDPRLASVIYAADRWEAAPKIEGWLDQGKVVVCDRYVDSNKAHQAARLPEEANRAAFLRWVDRLEYEVLGIPRPDFTLFLQVTCDVSSRLISAKGERAYLRGKKRDVHEADPRHLQRAGRIYKDLAAGRPRSRGAMIECVEHGRLLSRMEIADRVWAALQRRQLFGGPQSGSRSRK